MSRKVTLWTVARVVTGVLALTIGGVALAHDPAETADGSGWGYHAGAAGTVSQLLGLTPEEIHDEWLAGETLAEIAQAQGVSETDLVDAIMAAREEAVQQRVADGFITQEQADLMLQHMRENVTQMVNGTAGTFGDDGFCGFDHDGMMGSGFDHGGMMGGGWGGFR